MHEGMHKTSTEVALVAHYGAHISGYYLYALVSSGGPPARRKLRRRHQTLSSTTHNFRRLDRYSIKDSSQFIMQRSLGLYLRSRRKDTRRIGAPHAEAQARTAPCKQHVHSGLYH